MKLIEIKDINDKALSPYTSYNENQLFHIYEPDLGLFIAESPKVILRALKAGFLPESLLMEKGLDNSETREFFEILSRESVYDSLPLYVAPKETLLSLTGFNLTRGLLCAMKRKPMLSLSEIVKDCKRIAILEDVVNPTNVGAIIRSAAAMFIDAVILTSGCADPLYRRSARVSMGTVFQVPWTVLPSSLWPEEAFSILSAEDFKTVSLALTDDSVSIDNETLKSEQKLAIILGTEGDGLKSNTISKSDYTVKIPMNPGIDSLNVAAASAVAFFELRSR